MDDEDKEEGDVSGEEEGKVSDEKEEQETNIGGQATKDNEDKTMADADDLPAEEEAKGGGDKTVAEGDESLEDEDQHYRYLARQAQLESTLPVIGHTPSKNFPSRPVCRRHPLCTHIGLGTTSQATSAPPRSPFHDSPCSSIHPGSHRRTAIEAGGKMQTLRARPSPRMIRATRLAKLA